MTATLQSYTTGTVAVTNGSDIVELTGGTWLESWCVPGCDIRIAGESTAMVIAEWIDTTHVRLSIPIQRTTASGLAYAILMTAPAFGTNRLGALTAVERIRLMTENAVINQLLGVASGALAVPALQDRIGIWDASDEMNAKPGTLAAALKAGTSVLAKSANYAVTVDDYGSLIAMSAGTGARTATLPAAATAGTSFVIGIKKTDASANTVTIAASGTDKIDGAASLALTVQYGIVILRCDGTAWHVVVLENTSAFARTLLDDANAAAMQATLGVAPKQSSVTDTTAGAGLIVGAFGLGDNSQTIVSTGSMNDLTRTGWYYVAGAVADTPINATMQVQVIGQTAGSGRCVQIAHQVNYEARTWIRRQYGGTWSAWREVYNASSILATVSQSAGVPTGGLIERGSNANGQYIRFADGTQICMVQLTVSLNSNAFQPQTLPASFLTGSLVTGAVSFGDTPTTGASADWWNSTGSIGVYVSTTTAKLLFRGTNTATTGPCFIMVIGKWF